MSEMKPIIELVTEKIKIEEENQIFKAVANVDISVDKERLIRALNDANSFFYEGYEAGKNDAFSGANVAPVVIAGCEKSDDYDEWYTRYYTCMRCEAQFMVCDKKGNAISPNICPNCGAKMDL